MSVDIGTLAVAMSTVNRHAQNSFAAGPGPPYRGGMGTTNWAQRAIDIGDRKGINQTAIGHAVGKSRGWIGRIAAGRSRALIEDVVKVAECLGVSMDVLCRDEVPWIKSPEGLPVGFPHEDDVKALVRMVDALGIGYDEAIRRIASPPGGPKPEPRVVAGQVFTPPSSDDAGGDPQCGAADDEPTRKGRRVERGR